MEGNLAVESGGMAVPSPEELIGRARDMIPDLLERAQECEDLAHVPDQSIKEIKEKGLIRVCMPRKYGGYEYGWDVLVQICAEIAKGCASTAWVYAVYSEHANTVAGFSDAAQNDVWKDGPDVCISSGGNTGTPESIANKCTLTPVEGGYSLTGWATFSSGCHHADWIANNCTLADGSGILHILVPASEGTIMENWDTFALRGTGSNYVAFEDAFIPEYRTFPSADGLNGTTPGSKLYDHPVFRLPRISISPYSLVSVSVGVALGAVEQFVEAMKTRINRAGESVAQFQSIHLRIAESAAEARAAESLMLRNLRESEEILARGETLSDELRIRNKRDMAMCCTLSQRAVDRLFYAWGGGGLYVSNDIQRKLRDVKAAGAHHQTNWDIYMTAYGRKILGMDVPGVRF